MPSASFSTTIDRLAEDVLAYVADLRHTVTWMSFVDEVELVHGEPGGVGARFSVTAERALMDDIVMDYKTTDVQPGRSVTFAVRHPKLEGTDTYAIEAADGGGVTMSYTTEYEYVGLNKLATPFGALAGKAATNGLGHKLKHELETG